VGSLGSLALDGHGGGRNWLYLGGLEERDIERAPLPFSGDGERRSDQFLVLKSGAFIMALLWEGISILLTEEGQKLVSVKMTKSGEGSARGITDGKGDNRKCLGSRVELPGGGCLKAPGVFE